MQYLKIKMGSKNKLIRFKENDTFENVFQPTRQEVTDNKFALKGKWNTDLAIEKKYDYVICGHIHEPKIKPVETQKGKTIYLNSGDWVENLTALEYNNKRWKLYTHLQNAVSICKFEEENFEYENKLAEQFISILE